MSVQQAPQQATIDEGKVEAFMGKVLGNYMSATMTVTLCVIGDRLQVLFRGSPRPGRRRPGNCPSGPASTSATRSNGCVA